MKGFEVEKDPIKALIWFSMAKEYQFGDSHHIVSSMMQFLAPSEQKRVDEMVKNFKQLFGRTKVENELFPVMKT